MIHTWVLLLILISKMISTSQTHPIGPPLNLSSQAKEDVLLFTPIIGTGSSSVKNLLGFLKSENHFKLYSEPPKPAQVIHVPSEEAQVISSWHVFPRVSELDISPLVRELDTVYILDTLCPFSPLFRELDTVYILDTLCPYFPMS